MSLEIISTETLANKSIEQIRHVWIQLPSDLQFNSTDTTPISI